MFSWMNHFGRREAPQAEVAPQKRIVPSKPRPPVVRSLPKTQEAGKFHNGLVCALIYEAARDGTLQQVRALFDGNPHLVITPESYHSTTPLHIATERGKRDVAEFLLAKGLDVNAQDRNGSTPLHIAAEKGKSDIAELLLANGADINAPRIWKICSATTAVR